MLPSRFGNTFLTYHTFVTNLHLLRVELRCGLQEKLHRVTQPLGTSTESKKVRDVSKGGGGIQKNAHMTFLVGKIDK